LTLNINQRERRDFLFFPGEMYDFNSRITKEEKL
jgi:hypothetical protein